MLKQYLLKVLECIDLDTNKILSIQNIIFKWGNQLKKKF